MQGARRYPFASRLQTAVLAASVLLSTPARAGDAEPGDRLILEVGPRAEATLDARLTRRLVALEIADVDVPPAPGTAVPAPLYYRVLAESDGALRVELWELGKAQGARRVSSEGTAQLQARRIALAAGELARQLRRRRDAEIAAAVRPKAQGPKASEAATEFPIRGRVLWSAAVRGAMIRGAMIRGADAVLVGPAIGAAVRLSGRQTLGVQAAWLAGDSSTLAGTSLRWIEVGLGAAQGFPLSSRVDLHLGLSAAASSVHASATDDWSARAGLDAKLAWSTSPHLNLTLGPDVGAMLHAVRDDRGGKLSGLWLGATVGVELLP